MLEIFYLIFIVALLWFLYIYQKDVFEPEPLGKLLKAVAKKKSSDRGLVHPPLRDTD